MRNPPLLEGPLTFRYHITRYLPLQDLNPKKGLQLSHGDKTVSQSTRYTKMVTKSTDDKTTSKYRSESRFESFLKRLDNKKLNMSPKVTKDTPLVEGQSTSFKVFFPPSIEIPSLCRRTNSLMIRVLTTICSTKLRTSPTQMCA